ncbi:MAG: hypothetical protein GY714_19340, partial [Desulfobacterales bacterium]|nr:hypothetical protein [Desulfobacterales bacterium]
MELSTNELDEIYERGNARNPNKCRQKQKDGPRRYARLADEKTDKTSRTQGYSFGIKDYPQMTKANYEKLNLHGDCNPMLAWEMGKDGYPVLRTNRTYQQEFVKVGEREDGKDIMFSKNLIPLCEIDGVPYVEEKRTRYIELGKYGKK